jgi:hypothetical protein
MRQRININLKTQIITVLHFLFFVSASAQINLPNINQNKIVLTANTILQIDSTSFFTRGKFEKINNDIVLIINDNERFNIINEPKPDPLNFPYGLSQLNRYEKSALLVWNEGGASGGPFNRLLYSIDTGKTRITFTLQDAWSINPVLIYESMVFLEYLDVKNTSKKHYVLTTDTFKTFIELDWQERIGGRTFFKKGNFWRVGKQMGSNANKKSFGPNAEYFESKDNGLSWKKVTLPVKYNFEMLSPDTFYTASRSKVYWSYNAGQTWDSVSHNMPAKRVSDIWFANSDTGFAIMDGKRLYKTIDGGFKWDLAYLFECTTWFIDPWDENYILFHSINQAESNKDKLCIYRTTNGVSNPVGMQEIEMPNVENNRNSDFSLYPNPTAQSITLSTPNGQNAQLSIYNLMGQLQFHSPNQAPGNIDISQLATGLYIFELRQGNQVHRQRVEMVK